MSDIDECTTGVAKCHEKATCVNSPGSFDCVCEPGYTGDGTTCSGESTMPTAHNFAFVLILSPVISQELLIVTVDVYYSLLSIPDDPSRSLIIVAMHLAIVHDRCR